MNLVVPVIVWILVLSIALAMPVVAWCRRGAMAAAVALLAPLGAVLFAPVLMVAYAAAERPPLTWTSPMVWLGLVVAAGGAILAFIGVRAALRSRVPPGICVHCGHSCREGERCTECGRLHPPGDPPVVAASELREVKTERGIALPNVESAKDC